MAAVATTWLQQGGGEGGCCHSMITGAEAKDVITGAEAKDLRGLRPSFDQHVIQIKMLTQRCCLLPLAFACRSKTLTKI